MGLIESRSTQPRVDRRDAIEGECVVRGVGETVGMKERGRTELVKLT